MHKRETWRGSVWLTPKLELKNSGRFTLMGSWLTGGSFRLHTSVYSQTYQTETLAFYMPHQLKAQILFGPYQSLRAINVMRGYTVLQD
ncbi:hypothetical protein A3E49_02460 [Candidatus Saccharibacteria bacterium RIFCSPHIGHO2_12_FULL_49_19]|nr:MAG: hypothetical protein A2708_00170 [Candidatus Saccharibacteria bacterium RIFCSPHIGHO2_01_FULL_49_21]OGL37841.1 MAG: hypothetical protein A3E49_02460 [Candidatus Saccharibacteria bacterium RIFCSPHIGHO2_12_FULL_49_19]OGL38332.1 MAG: hypothetical protein A3B63_03510 [Candidatus Saccharibacteria bacterium RIFCSPLOWO2_01_FULL_49_22]